MLATGYTSGSQSVVSGPAASASPGNANSRGPAPEQLNQKHCDQDPAIHVLTSLPGVSDV